MRSALTCQNHECLEAAAYAVSFTDDDLADAYCPDCLANILLAMALHPRFHAYIRAVDLVSES